MSPSSSKRFPELTHDVNGETNHDSWIINIKALLRPKGLWQCTQEPLPENPSTALKNKHIDSADMITHHISGGVKAKLAASVFDDGYLMLSAISGLIIPATEQTFYAASQELFSLRLGYDNAENLDSFLTRIKILNEKIEATKIEFTADKRTLLVLMLGLSDPYESLVRIWGTIPDLTAEKAITMLRADAQREDDRERIKCGHSFAVAGSMAAVALRGGARLSQKRLATSCKVCGKHPTGTECWATIKCDYCGKRGHPDYRCHKREQDTGVSAGARAGVTVRARPGDGLEESTTFIEC